MKIRDKKTWNNLSMGLMGLLKQIPVNLYTKKHNKQIKTDKAWDLAANVFLIGLAVLAVFYIKGKHHSSNNPKSGVEKLKNPSHKNYKKNDNNRSKPLNP
ncbi:hypothetical protein HpDR147_03370 [Helicobacter pylori]